MEAVAEKKLELKMDVIAKDQRNQRLIDVLQLITSTNKNNLKLV